MGGGGLWLADPYPSPSQQLDSPRLALRSSVPTHPSLPPFTFPCHHHHHPLLGPLQNLPWLGLHSPLWKGKAETFPGGGGFWDWVDPLWQGEGLPDTYQPFSSDWPSLPTLPSSPHTGGGYYIGSHHLLDYPLPDPTTTTLPATWEVFSGGPFPLPATLYSD